MGLSQVGILGRHGQITRRRRPSGGGRKPALRRAIAGVHAGRPPSRPARHAYPPRRASPPRAPPALARLCGPFPREGAAHRLKEAAWLPRYWSAEILRCRLRRGGGEGRWPRVVAALAPELQNAGVELLLGHLMEPPQGGVLVPLDLHLAPVLGR